MFDKSSRFRKYEEFIIVAYVRWLGTIRGQRAKSLKIFKLMMLHNLICKERSKVLCSKTAEIQRGIYTAYLEACSTAKTAIFRADIAKQRFDDSTWRVRTSVLYLREV